MSYHKLLVIGLDGAPYPLIEQWTRSGHLPNLARLIQRGSFAPLLSTIPVHSPTAWSSFITGTNPGKHGVFDFVKREANSYQLRVVRSHQIAGSSLWQLLSQNGRKIGLLNVPMTYPPQSVNGFWVSGLGTPSYVPYTFPPELTERLNQQGYRVNKEKFYQPGHEEEWLADIYDTSQRRTAATIALMKEQEWDFFMMVFRNTDEICHFFWRYMDETHPLYEPDAPMHYKNAIRDYYQQVDSWVGEIVATAPADSNIVVMSDHGAGPLYKDVFLNEWLWQQGWLTMKEESASQRRSWHLARRLGLTRANISDLLTKLHLHRLEVWIKQLLGDRILVLPRDERPEFMTAIDWERTKAYSFGYYGQIFINMQGREPAGTVAPDDYLSFRQEIADQLRLLMDPEDGKPVVDQIYFKEQLYHGEQMMVAPDILCIMRGLTYITRKGYEFSQQRGVLFRPPYTFESGSHRPEGILIGAGPDIVCGGALGQPQIFDLTPVLLQLLDCEVPASMDGKPIPNFLTPEFLDSHPIQASQANTPIAEPHQLEQWDEAAEAEIQNRLRSLGYLN